MKRESRFICFPTQLWDNTQLSWMAKIVLMEIDSYPRTELGVNVRSGAVATALGITKKECDTAIKELCDKGALQINFDEGQNLFIPLIYKDEYLYEGQTVSADGEKPSTANTIDYDDVSSEWAAICPMLPPIQRWTPQRKRKLKAALNQADLTVGDLYKAFRIIASVPFLNGSSNQFNAHFDWLVRKSENLQKVYEGYYSHSYSEKQAYEQIMQGGEMANTKSNNNDGFYR